MIERRTNFEPGMLFLLSEGKWSDYGLEVLCRALKSFTKDHIKAEYLQQFPEQAHFSDRQWKEGEKNPNFYQGFDADTFVAWLEQSGYIEQVECYEFWAGAYGRIYGE